MPENLYVNIGQFNKIEKYFFEKDISFSNQIINLGNGRQIKAQPYEGKIEIMCNDKNTIETLRRLIKNDN